MNGTNYVIGFLKEYKPNRLIQVSKLYDNELKKEVSEAGYYKTIERMHKKGDIIKLAKGLYCIPEKTKYGIVFPSNEYIIEQYTKNGQGMQVGYRLYNELNLTTQIAKTYQILSNAIYEQNKTIGNITIKRVDLEFDEQTVKIVEMFEVLNNYRHIQDFNYKGMVRYCERFITNQDLHLIENVIKEMKYPKRTISFMKNILDYYKKENNLGKYLSSLSKYEHPKMEEIYELARM